jgi:hypothetical protein
MGALINLYGSNLLKSKIKGVEELVDKIDYLLQAY